MRTSEAIGNSCYYCSQNICGPECAYYGEAPAECRKFLLRDASDVIKSLLGRENESAVNTYWGNICALNARQEEKGLKKYGESLEDNTTLTTEQRIEHLEEELIDALKYCEHLKMVARDGITANDYQRAAMRTATGEKSEWLENAIYGIIGEAGEIVDLVKKHKWQGHELNVEELILECGDLSWYVALLVSALDKTLGEVYTKNIKKLEDRYPTGFSKERSVNRE